MSWCQHRFERERRERERRKEKERKREREGIREERRREGRKGGEEGRRKEEMCPVPSTAKANGESMSLDFKFHRAL